MTDQDTVALQKQRGPPPTGKGTPVVVRMQLHQLAAIDAWAVENGRLTGTMLEMHEQIQFVY